MNASIDTTPGQSNHRKSISLREQRLAMRLSQAELARKANVQRPRITLFELGDGKLTELEQRRIREALERESARLRGIAVDVDFSQPHADQVAV